MFFNGLMTWFLNVFLSTISYVTSIIFLPIYLTLETFIPDFSSYSEVISNFLNNYLLKGVAFAREVAFNITGFPRPLFNFLIGYLVFKFGLFVAKGAFRAISSAYFIVRGTK